MTTFKQFVVAEPKTEPKTDSKTDSKTDWQCHVVLINGKLKSVDCKKGNPPPKGKPPPNKRIALPLPVVTTKGVRGADRESKEEEVPKRTRDSGRSSLPTVLEKVENRDATTGGEANDDQRWVGPKCAGHGPKETTPH